MRQRHSGICRSSGAKIGPDVRRRHPAIRLAQSTATTTITTLASADDFEIAIQAKPKAVYGCRAVCGIAGSSIMFEFVPVGAQLNPHRVTTRFAMEIEARATDRPDALTPILVRR
jgi:hypothetical protein